MFGEESEGKRPHRRVGIDARIKLKWIVGKMAEGIDGAHLAKDRAGGGIL
jgi:hypothetical protein